MNILKEWLTKLKEYHGKMLHDKATQLPQKPPVDPANPVPVPKPVKPKHEDM